MPTESLPEQIGIVYISQEAQWRWNFEGATRDNINKGFF